MDLSRPLRVVTPTLEAAVLAVLAAAEASFTGEQTARMIADGSPSGVRRALERLVATGLVLRQEAGPAYLYRLNRDHLAATHVIALTKLRETFAEKVAELVSSWPTPPQTVVLFGSAARGEMHAGSDIDLFIARPTGADDAEWCRRVGDLEEQVTAWTGNDARVLEMDAVAAVANAPSDPVLADIADHGQVLYGEPGYLRRLNRARARASAGTGA
jgi:predicted nucleotidyltransferase